MSEPAIQARDEALAQVEERSTIWRERAYLNSVNYLRVIKKGQEFTGEQLRLWLEVKVGKPPSPGCMGALVMRLVKEPVIIKVGYGNMQTEKSHGRETKKYRWAY